MQLSGLPRFGSGGVLVRAGPGGRGLAARVMPVGGVLRTPTCGVVLAAGLSLLAQQGPEAVAAPSESRNLCKLSFSSYRASFVHAAHFLVVVLAVCSRA